MYFYLNDLYLEEIYKISDFNINILTTFNINRVTNTTFIFKF